MALEKYYEELTRLYDRLRKYNEEFLIKKQGQQDFDLLVDQRSVDLDDLAVIRSGIISELESEDSDYYASMELPDLIRELPQKYPCLLKYRNKVIEALEKLIKSEKDVSDFMSRVGDEIKLELTKARVGQNTLNAYKPISGYDGSHFIDRKK